MLILTRKADQAIVIQGNITVTVMSVERDRVKLKIEAPSHIRILREELIVDTDEEDLDTKVSPLRQNNASTPPVTGSLALQPRPEDE